MIEQGRRLQALLGIPEERVEWVHANIMDVPPRALRRRSTSTGRCVRRAPGRAFYEMFAREAARAEPPGDDRQRRGLPAGFPAGRPSASSTTTARSPVSPTAAGVSELDFDAGFASRPRRRAGRSTRPARYDVLVLGAGPAGICAAIYLVRKGLATGVIAQEPRRPGGVDRGDRELPRLPADRRGGARRSASRAGRASSRPTSASASRSPGVERRGDAVRRPRRRRRRTPPGRSSSPPASGPACSASRASAAARARRGLLRGLRRAALPRQGRRRSSAAATRGWRPRSTWRGVCPRVYLFQDEPRLTGDPVVGAAGRRGTRRSTCVLGTRGRRDPRRGAGARGAGAALGGRRGARGRPRGALRRDRPDPEQRAVARARAAERGAGRSRWTAPAARRSRGSSPPAT